VQTNDFGPFLGPDLGSTPYPIEIGREPTLSRFFWGYISQIVIYTRKDGTLSDDQIRAWYDATKVDYQ
jgi:hypothetical protein